MLTSREFARLAGREGRTNGKVIPHTWGLISLNCCSCQHTPFLVLHLFPKTHSHTLTHTHTFTHTLTDTHSHTQTQKLLMTLLYFWKSNISFPYNLPKLSQLPQVLTAPESPLTPRTPDSQKSLHACNPLVEHKTTARHCTGGQSRSTSNTELTV